MIKTSTGAIDITVMGTTVKLKDDDRIAQSVLGGKPFEPQTLDFFVEHCRRNQSNVFLDIGCYSGLFSMIAQKEGMTPIGFEPFPDNYRQIMWNMELNNEYFELSRYALSDKTGDARFGHTNVHLTSGGSLERKSGNGLSVKTMKLDDFYISKVPVGIIKMDVERHEPAVIRGARAVIKKHLPVMIIEANDLVMRTFVEKEMRELGYACSLELDVRNLIFTPR